MIFYFPRVKQFPRIAATGTVINLRGTNGSGKTTIIMKLMKKFGVKPLEEDGKVWGYKLRTPNKKVFIVGKYETPTGGCDGISKLDEVCRRVAVMARMGDVVLFEGFLISGLTSRFVSLAKGVPTHKFKFVILDTPVEKCIKRTIKRRQARGNLKHFDPKNLRQKFQAVDSSRKYLEREGMDVRVVNHKKAFNTIVDWIREGR